MACGGRPQTLATRSLQVAETLGVDVTKVSIDAAAASVRLTITVRYDTQDAAEAGAATLEEKIASNSDASTFLSTPQLNVDVEAVTQPSVTANASPDGGGNGGSGNGGGGNTGGGSSPPPAPTG